MSARAKRDGLGDGAPEVVPLFERLPRLGSPREAAWMDAPRPAARSLFADGRRPASSPLVLAPAAAALEPVIVPPLPPIAGAPPPSTAPAPTSPPPRSEPSPVVDDRASALRDAEARLQAEAARYVDAVAALAARQKAALVPPAADVVALAMLVAREILGREPAADRRHLEAALDEALAASRRSADVVVRLAAVDHDQALRRRPELSESGVRLVRDARLEPGDCVVERPDGIDDHSVGARLDQIARALRAALEDAESERLRPVEAVAC